MSVRPPRAPPTHPLGAVYDALRQLAEQRLAGERPGHTLSATALVHDVYIRLAGEAPDRWADAAHFYAVAAEAMRRVLVDHARARAADKRGGPRRRVPLNEAADVATLSDAADPADVLALDAAVTRLAELYPDVALVVQLRFYAGRTVDETAAATGFAPRTVKRHWAFARAWLYQRLSPDE